MVDKDWDELDQLMMLATNNVYLSIRDCENLGECSRKLGDTDKKSTTSNKFYMMKRLYEISIKDSNLGTIDINEFDIII